jgi:hypothetical protein
MAEGSVEIDGFCRAAERVPAIPSRIHDTSQIRKGRYFIAASSGKRDKSMLQKKGSQNDLGQSAVRMESKGLSISI